MKSISHTGIASSRVPLTRGLRLLAVVAAVSIAAVAAAAPAAADQAFFVSPDGNDAWQGTKKRPFETLHRAQQAVRAATPGMDSDVVVNLRGGTYFLHEPLTLASTAGDSGTGGHRVIWQAYRFGTAAREQVTISGGRPIDGWTLIDASANTWRADVGNLRTRQLYVDGSRARRASRGSGLPGDVTRTASGYETDSTAPQTWGNPDDVELVYRGSFTEPGWPWTEPRCGVSDISGDAEGSTITMDQPCFQRAIRLYSVPLCCGPADVPLMFDVENARAFLDEPGEFYLDRSAPGEHSVYYMPRPGEQLSGEPSTQSRVVAAELETLVTGEGTEEAPLHDVTFRGLTFAHATWLTPSDPSGYPHIFGNLRYIGDSPNWWEILINPNFETTPGNVYFRAAERITLKNNRFTHLGGLALEFSRSSSWNKVVSNIFDGVSEGALAMGILPPYTEGVNEHNRVVNNLARNIGVEYRGAPGMWISLTRDTTVAHNELRDVPNSGIVSNLDAIFGIAQGERIVHNRIDGAVQELDDGGGLYMVGDHGSSFETGAVVGGNFITNGPGQGQHSLGLYTDDTMNWATLKRNVVFGYDTAAGGCVWSDGGVSNLRYDRNFWDAAEPAWGCGGEPYNVSLTNHTVLDPADPELACEQSPVCASTTRRAGLKRNPG